MQVVPFEQNQFRLVSDLRVTELTAAGTSGEAVKNEQVTIELQRARRPTSPASPSTASPSTAGS